MKLKKIKAGTVEPNTVEISNVLTNITTFKEHTIKYAGFKIENVVIAGEIPPKKEEKTVTFMYIRNHIKIPITKATRHRIGVTRIYTHFDETIAEILKCKPEATWSIKELNISKNKNIFKFKVIGNGTDKRMLLTSVNKIKHNLYSIESLIEKLAPLFNATCYFNRGKARPVPIVCDSSKTDDSSKEIEHKKEYEHSLVAPCKLTRWSKCRR
jgi:hypothetical protein